MRETKRQNTLHDKIRSFSDSWIIYTLLFFFWFVLFARDRTNTMLAQSTTDRMKIWKKLLSLRASMYDAKTTFAA